MSRLVLAFDTSTEVCAIALGRRDDDAITVLASADLEAPRAAMSQLMPAIDAMLAGADVGVRDVAEVVVGRGPGSFTGVRIGVATAKGIAHGLRVPLHGVGTLDAIAWGTCSEEHGVEGLLGVVGDAMRGEVYPALFRVDAARRPLRLSPDRVARPEDAASEWAALRQPLALAGNGLARYAEAFSSALGERGTILPRARWLVTGRGLLAAYGAARAEGSHGSGDPGSLLPIYTRLSDAEQAEHERHGRGTPEPPSSGVQGPQDDAGTERSDAS